MAFYYNTTKHGTTRESLYALVFGKDVVDNHILRGLHDQLDSQSLLWEVKEKRAALRETTAQQKCLKRQKASGHTRTTLEVGDLVWVYQS